MKKTTIKDLDGFTIGESVNIEDLEEWEARAIFGDPVYESWLKWKDQPR